MTAAQGAWLVARREIRDQGRDWRILAPIVMLTLFFPLLMNFTARAAVDFVTRYGAPIVGERLIPFLLLVVGFFPISISLVIALESFAGERERLSLEPLLVTPLSNMQLYTGKMLASLVAPVLAAYLGIVVYSAGLILRLGWSPPPQLLVQVVLLTTAQALVMVAGAVVISSLTTSVRAANLLASFIIIPVAQLVILESLIMFWGQYDVLWYIVIGLVVTAALLLRMGIHLFNREELLGRELDVLNLAWMGRVIRTEFVAGARGLGSWYAGLLRRSLPRALPALALTALVMAFGYAVGLWAARQWTLPAELFALEADRDLVLAHLQQLGFLSPQGWLWVLGNNAEPFSGQPARGVQLRRPGARAADGAGSVGGLLRREHCAGGGVGRNGHRRAGRAARPDRDSGRAAGRRRHRAVGDGRRDTGARALPRASLAVRVLRVGTSDGRPGPSAAGAGGGDRGIHHASGRAAGPLRRLSGWRV
jgi:ABC-type transport system involved in multi-copper enzyme maturation permease subunit